MNRFQEKLHKVNNRHDKSYIDFHLEYPVHTGGQLVFDEIPSINLGNIPGIRLPNGNSFYLCCVPLGDFQRICELESFQGKFISDSWEDLWASDYLYKNYVFEGEGKQDGQFWRQKLAKIKSDVTIEKVYPPGVFLGDSVPLLLNIENQKHLNLDLSKTEIVSDLRLVEINEELTHYLRNNPEAIYHLPPRKFWGWRL